MVQFLWIPVILLPLLEIITFLAVADEIGVLAALAICVVAAFVGFGLISRHGIGSFMRAQANLREGRSPFTDVTQGLFIVVAGLLFIFPGFVSDILALLLLALSPGPARWREWFGPNKPDSRPRPQYSPANDPIIEGEFERVDSGSAEPLRGDSGRANPPV